MIRHTRVALLAMLSSATAILSLTAPGSGNTAAIKGMEKYVSKEATVVLYRPIGWDVYENTGRNWHSVAVADPSSQYEAGLVIGTDSSGAGIYDLVDYIPTSFSRHSTEVALKNAKLSPDGSKLVFEMGYAPQGKGSYTGKCWISQSGGNFTIFSCQAPATEFKNSSRLLLTILTNIRMMRAAGNGASAQLPQPLPLKPMTLSDGSATFAIPANWTFVDLGKCSFVASNPSGPGSFMVCSTEILSPNLGVQLPNVPVSPYLVPHKALQFLAESQGLASDMQFDVTPRADLARLIATVYTAGPVNVEEFVYTYRSHSVPCKGYSFGVSFGSRIGAGWRFWHISAGMPARDFDAFLPTIQKMVQTYRIDDKYAMNYIAEGTRKLRQMVKETADLVARNSRDIHAMMQAAYDERQRSQDYIDYQRTNYIRGQSDWVSGMEGGSVYHTDNWGTRNTATGETLEGKPFDYINFTGANPRYNEQMTPVNSRELYERFVRR